MHISILCSEIRRNPCLIGNRTGHGRAASLARADHAQSRSERGRGSPPVELQQQGHRHQESRLGLNAGHGAGKQSSDYSTRRSNVVTPGLPSWHHFLVTRSGTLSNQIARYLDPMRNGATSLSLEQGPAAAHRNMHSSIPGKHSGHSPVDEIADDETLGGGVGRLPRHNDVITVCIVAPQVHGCTRSPCDQRVRICQEERTRGWEQPEGPWEAHWQGLRSQSSHCLV